MLQGMEKNTHPHPQKRSVESKQLTDVYRPMQLTLPETNTVPEEKWLEDYFAFERVPFLGDVFVCFRGCIAFSFRTGGTPGAVDK